MKIRLAFLCTSLVLVIMSMAFTACNETYSPKPKGYFRIDMPRHEYQVFDSSFPYSFSYPVYARVVPKTDSGSEPYWINIEFPKYKGTLHLSYKPLDHDLTIYTEESRMLVMKHIPKANAIEEHTVSLPENAVYGKIFQIKGSEAASTLQFYLTDSSRHFVRAALYFWVSPNNDSLEPVIRYLDKDIEKIISSFRWKEPKP